MTKPSSRRTVFDDQTSIDIHCARRAHLVGIAGSGMRSLARVLAAAGWKISGSDNDSGSLANAPFKVVWEHDAAQVDATLEVVVYSDAVPAENPELRRARDLGIPTLSYPQMLGRLMRSYNGVAVAGTHGKSTTTAMAGSILVAAGLDPSVIVGAEAFDPPSGSRLGRGRWMLAEACEYRPNFRYLTPQIVTLLGIEPDHFDCFRAPDELERAFTEFAQQVPREGLILARADCAATQRAVQSLDCSIESFGLGPTATWRASAVRERRGLYSFEIRCRDRLLCDVKLPVPGRHNMLNALAAATLASHCGATGGAIRRGLERFGGLKRRLETVCEERGIAEVDDYGHHPTEVAAALGAVRQMYPDRRVWCVFQPHQISRTRQLLDGFARSLQNADRIVVAEIFGAREPAPPAGEVQAGDLAARAATYGANAIHLPSLDQIRHHLRNSLQSGDVVVTLGAGDIGKIAHELAKELRTFRQAG